MTTNPNKMAGGPAVRAPVAATIRVDRFGAHVASLVASLGPGVHHLYSASTVAGLEAEVERLAAQAAQAVRR